MQVKVLKAFKGKDGKAILEGETTEIDDKVVGAWIEGGWVAPIENKLLPPPIENKGIAEPTKPVRRKIKHRKKAVKK